MWGIHIQTQRLNGFIKYAIKICSGGMICKPSFMKIGSEIQKLLGGYTDTQDGDSMIVVIFFKIEKLRMRLMRSVYCLCVYVSLIIVR
jgi:hypothetical protein